MASSRCLWVMLAATLCACDRVVPVEIEGAPSRGPTDAWVTLVEFGDFQCKYCALEAPVLAELEQAFREDLRVVYKHFPLDFHAHARPAAIASECARAQGLFWPMHDQLIAHHDALQPTDIEGYAALIGLDVDAWRACLSTEGPGQRVDADAAEGARHGVSATPTEFINGRMRVGAHSVDELRAEIASARATAMASGIPRERYYREAVLGD